jgi:regulator of sirC expression with transglutaminase-like and TPR domain
LPKIIKSIQPSIAVITTFDLFGNARKQGSGFFIGRGGIGGYEEHVITNRHVLVGAYKAEVRTADGKTYKVNNMVSEDIEGDLARISVYMFPAEMNHLQLRQELPEVGEKILVIGSPLGLEQTVSDGIVSAIREIPPVGKTIQISAPISSGSSGSPVVDAYGKVIGVATFQIREGQNLNFAIPAERILHLPLSLPKQVSLFNWTITAVESLEKKAEEAIEAGNYERAVELNSELLELDPTSWREIHLGLVYRKLLHLDKAIDAFEKAIQIYLPTYDHGGSVKCLADAYALLGDTFTFYGNGAYIEKNGLQSYADQQNHYQKAKVCFLKSIEIKPDIVATHLGLADAYAVLEMPDLAEKEFIKAISLDPKDTSGYMALGQFYIHQGNYELAMKQYEVLAKLDAKQADLFLKIYNMLRKR